MAVHMFMSDEGQRDFARWSKAMLASRDQYGWVRWEDAPPPRFGLVETKRASDPDYIKPVWIDAEKLDPAFNLAGLLWRDSRQGH